MQAQVAITGTKYCDFVVWHENGVIVERILPDPEFMSSEVGKVNIMSGHVILPELLGKIISRSSGKSTTSTVTQSDDQAKWCYCQNGDDSTLIRCMGVKCAIKQFHKACTGLKRVPKHWMCIDCTNTESQIEDNVSYI